MGEYIILAGAIVIFFGALVFFRFPNPLQKIHSSSLINFVGFGLILIGEVWETGWKTGDWAARELFAVLIVIVIGPLTAHLLSRAKIEAKGDFQSEIH